MSSSESLKSIIESLLFVSGDSILLKNLADVVKISKKDVEEIIENLANEYKEEKRGIRILKNGEEISMATVPENGEFVKSFLKSDANEELSKAALETLSIIAYRGPIERGMLEEIRGVNCNFIVRKLLIRGLIERVNNPNDARIYLYQASMNLIKELGLEKISDLPNYQNLSKKQILNQGIVV